MLQNGDQVFITTYDPPYPQYSGCTGIITAVMLCNHVGDQRTLYDVQIADTTLCLYENEIIPLYPVLGLH